MLWLIEQVEKIKLFDLVSLIPCLSEERREKFARFRHEPSAVQSALAELLLRYALREEYGQTALPDIHTGGKGKPFFPGRPDIHFNLSHCSKAVACALDADPVGVDVQEIRPLRRDGTLPSASPSLPLEGKVSPVRTLVTDEVVPQARRTPSIYRVLSEPERAWVEAGETQEEQDRRFTAVWTCKEAWGKALGVGFLYDLKSSCFLPDKETWRQHVFTFFHLSREAYELTLCSRELLPCVSVSFEEIRDKASL